MFETLISWVVWSLITRVSNCTNSWHVCQLQISCMSGCCLVMQREIVNAQQMIGKAYKHVVDRQLWVVTSDFKRSQFKLRFKVNYKPHLNLSCIGHRQNSGLRKMTQENNGECCHWQIYGIKTKQFKIVMTCQRLPWGCLKSAGLTYLPYGVFPPELCQDTWILIMGFEALAHWDMNIQNSFDSTLGNKGEKIGHTYKVKNTFIP